MKKSIFALLLALTLFLSCSFVSGAVSVNQVFSYADSGWGKGNNVTPDGLWKYEWFARETETFADMDWNASESFFEAQYETANSADTHWYCRVRNGGGNLHPGAQADAVRTFICPESGKVQYTVSLQRQAMPSNNGNTVQVRLNNTPLSVNGSTEPTLEDTSTFSINLTIDVKKGDLIRLMIGSQGNSGGDGVNVSGHKVKYLSGPNLEAEKPSFTITCVGDSITEGMQTSGGLKGPKAYPAVLKGLLDKTGIAQFTVNNCGKSGTTALKSGDKPYVDTAEYTTSKASDPDVVIICFGANDSKKANWNATKYKTDYKNLISEYLNLPSKPKVYLFYTTYVADQSKTGCTRTVIQNEILPIQRQIAKELGLKIIDLNTLTKNNSTKYADGVHPNDELQGMMAEYIFNALCAEGAFGLSSKNATAAVSMIDPSRLPGGETSSGNVSSGGVSSDSGTSDDLPAATDGGGNPDSGDGTQSAGTPGTNASTDASDLPSDGTDVTDSGAKSKTPNRSSSSNGNSGWILWGVLGGVVLLAGAGVAVWYFCFFKKKQ